MAGPYYVDISAPGAWVGKTGLDKTTNALLGLSGLQYLLDTVSVGNGPIYVKGSASDGSKMKTLACDNLSGVFQRGESVTWDGGASNGVVSELTSDYPSVIEVITGTLENDDALVGVTSEATADVNGAPAQKDPIINVDTQSGTNAGGFIKVIGCKDDADYTVAYGTERAIIDVKSAAATGMLSTNASDMYWIENIRITAAGTAKNGFHTVSGSDGWVFINCRGDLCAYYGFAIAGGYSLIIQCVANNNTLEGFFVGGTANKVLFCAAYDNARDGFLGTSESVMIGCIGHGGTGAAADGFADIGPGAFLMNCVADGNAVVGIRLSAGTNPRPIWLFGNRITNQSGASDIGIDFVGDPAVTGWNHYENNTDHHANDALNMVMPDITQSYIPGTTTLTNTNNDSDTDTNQGYAEAVANNNFATGYTGAGDPLIRRKAITIPWT